MDSLISVGVNRRFKDETLYAGRSLRTEGFGTGAAGEAAATAAALAREGSELVYQDKTGQWFATELGEGNDPQDLRALSEVDQAEIKLHPTLGTKQGMHNARVVFKDARPGLVLDQPVSALSTTQKLTLGNTEVAKNLLHKAKVAVLHPLATGSDLTVGMAVNTWQTLTNPQEMLASVSATYSEDKVEGVIHGVKVGASLVASAALVVGTTVAVGNLANRGFSLANGIAMEKEFVANPPNMFHALRFGDRSAAYNVLLSRAQTSAAVGRQLASIGQITSKVGKVASLTLLGATSLSLAKNQWDLAQAQDMATFKKEVHAITQDAGSLAQSAVSYGAQKLFQRLAEQARQLYRETSTYKQVSPQHQAMMEAKIEQWASEISKRAASEIPELQPKTWQNLSVEQKGQALIKLQKIASEVQNTPQIPVHLTEDYGGGAVFVPDEKAIYFGTDLLNSSVESANVLVHEQFHNLQNHMMEMFKQNPASLESFWTDHAEMWLDNTERYVMAGTSPGVSLRGKEVISTMVVGDVYPSANAYSDYTQQPLERGAWRIGGATQSKLTDLLPQD